MQRICKFVMLNFELVISAQSIVVTNKIMEANL